MVLNLCFGKYIHVKQQDHISSYCLLTARITLSHIHCSVKLICLSCWTVTTCIVWSYYGACAVGDIYTIQLWSEGLVYIMYD